MYFFRRLFDNFKDWKLLQKNKADIRIFSINDDNWVDPCNIEKKYPAAIELLYEGTRDSLIIFINGYAQTELSKLKSVIKRGITPKLFVVDAILPNWVYEFSRKGKIIIYQGCSKEKCSEAIGLIPLMVNEHVVVTKLIISDENSLLVSTYYVIYGHNEHGSVTKSNWVCFNCPEAKRVYKNFLELQLNSEWIRI